MLEINKQIAGTFIKCSLIDEPFLFWTVHELSAGQNTNFVQTVS